MAKNAVNYTGLIPEVGDSFESATTNTTGNFEGIDTKIGIIDDNITDINNDISNVDNTSDLTKVKVNTYADLNTTDKTIVGAINETIVTDSAVNGNIKIAGVESKVYTHPNHSGDIVSIGDGVTTIKTNVVDNTKLTQMPTMTIKGNDAVGNADPQDLTVSEVQTMLSDSTHRFVTDVEKTTWNSASAGVNTGDILFRTSNTIPTGYLKANGATISRTTYSDLFSVIGTTFGVGDGSTTFNLPDLRGEFIRGWDDARGIDSGRSLGSAQSDAIQEHRHSAGTDGKTAENPDTAYNLDGKTINGITYGTSNQAGNSGYASQTTSRAVPETSTGTIRTSTETRPRNIALMAIIKY